jgi:FAD/FMN-containing dehydrogenase
MKQKTKWWLVGTALATLVVAVLLARPVVHLVRTWWYDRREVAVLPRGFVDDASRMNRTAVAEVWDIPADPAAAQEQLRTLVRRAKADGHHVAIAGARHSMGGHTIAAGGVVLNMLPFHAMSLDDTAGILNVGAGARWSEVIPYLDTRGRSVAIMQSNDSFSVGGSISVNCHGWQLDRPPIIASVESFTLLTADGEIHRCSRSENAELFALVPGGYGLFGVILDVRLRVVPNERYRVKRHIFPSEKYEAVFDQEVTKSGDAAMAFGRLCIVPGEATFLREAIVTSFHRDPAADGAIPRLSEVVPDWLTRTVYRGSIDSDYGKHLRWSAEKAAGELLAVRHFSRNQILHQGVEILQDRSAETTDILHEYFVPTGRVESFLDRLRALIPRHRADLLNVTVRSVRRDRETVLRYAERDMFSFVMLFSQLRTPEADAGMEALTRELIDAALALEGTYYLPYRLHATPAQFRQAYPGAARFFERKHHYDPDDVFQNRFFERYGSG